MVPNGWEVKQLDNICSKPISYGIVQTGPDVANGIPCIRVVDLSKNDMNIPDMIKTTDEIHQSYKKTILQGNELVMALRGEIGLVKLVPNHLVGANITRGIARLAPQENIVDSKFLLWAMRSYKVKKDLTRKSGGSALQEISLTALRKVEVSVPPLPEQQKIAKILFTWDKAISTTERLIDNSTLQKKALMQQLLTGKKRLLDESGKRFEGEFNQHRLSELVNIDKKSLGKNTPENYEFEYISLSDVSTGTISKSLERHIFSSAPSRARRIVRENDLLLATVRPNLKGFAKVRKEHDGFVASTGFAVLTAKKDVSSDYVYHYLFSHHLTGQINALVVGSNYPAINSSDVGSLKILCPSLKEQQKIATVLTNADREIELLEQQLAGLQQEKKALMQVLLTGKKRVLVDGEVA